MWPTPLKNASFGPSLGSDDGNAIDLFYCVRSRQSAAHLEELEALAANSPRLTLHVVASNEGARLTADAIQQALGSIDGHRALFCGPEGMRKGFKAGLAKHGIWGRNFAYEEFEIRSGIGLRALFSFLVRRFIKPSAA